MVYLEDIEFFEGKTKCISSSLLKNIRIFTSAEVGGAENAKTKDFSKPDNFGIKIFVMF